MVLVCYFSGGVKGFDSIRFGPAAQSIILYVGWVLHWALGFNRGIEVLKLEGYTLHDLFLHGGHPHTHLYALQRYPELL